jgi:hypothetical protein
VTSTLAFSAKKLSFLRSKFLPYLHNVLLANKIWSKAGIAVIFIEIAIPVVGHGIVGSTLPIGVEAPGGGPGGGHGILDAVHAVGVAGDVAYFWRSF